MPRHVSSLNLLLRVDTMIEWKIQSNRDELIGTHGSKFWLSYCNRTKSKISTQAVIMVAEDSSLELNAEGPLSVKLRQKVLYCPLAFFFPRILEIKKLTS